MAQTSPNSGIVEEFWSKKRLEEENLALKEQVAYMQECIDAQPMDPLHWKDYLIFILAVVAVSSVTVAAMLLKVLTDVGGSL